MEEQEQGKEAALEAAQEWDKVCPPATIDVVEERAQDVEAGFGAEEAAKDEQEREVFNLMRQLYSKPAEATLIAPEPCFAPERQPGEAFVDYKKRQKAMAALAKVARLGKVSHQSTMVRSVGRPSEGKADEAGTEDMQMRSEVRGVTRFMGQDWVAPSTKRAQEARLAKARAACALIISEQTPEELRALSEAISHDDREAWLDAGFALMTEEK